MSKKLPPVPTSPVLWCILTALLTELGMSVTGADVWTPVQPQSHLSYSHGTPGSHSSRSSSFSSQGRDPQDIAVHLDGTSEVSFLFRPGEVFTLLFLPSVPPEDCLFSVKQGWAAFPAQVLIHLQGHTCTSTAAQGLGHVLCTSAETSHLNF